MMHTFYHASLEKILNTALRCLPEGSMPVGTDATDFLDGKVVALDTTDWPLGFQLRLSSKPVWSFVVDPADTVVPDAVLRGRLIDLFSAGLQGGDVRHLHAHQVHFAGDAGVAQAMQSVLKQLDVDIEAMMAEVTGDVVAHHAGRLGRALCRRVKHASSRVTKQFTVYAQEESALLVDPSSVALFTRDVRVLRQDADRLEARVRALEVAAEGSEDHA